MTQGRNVTIYAASKYEHTLPVALPSWRPPPTQVCVIHCRRRATTRPHHHHLRLHAQLSQGQGEPPRVVRKQRRDLVLLALFQRGRYAVYVHANYDRGVGGVGDDTTE